MTALEVFITLLVIVIFIIMLAIGVMIHDNDHHNNYK